MISNDIVKERILNKNINSFFDCLTDILLKYSNNSLDTCQDFEKYFSKYMVCRYLSMNSKFINMAEYLNSIQQLLSNKQFYHLVYSLVPKQNTAYIKYIKANKSNNLKNKDTYQQENNLDNKNNLFNI